MVRSISLIALTMAFLGAACGPRYIAGTKVEATEEREEVAAVVEQYRRALEQRDTDAVRKLVSETYYENASTTEDPSDDYDAEGLVGVLGDLKRTVKAVKYEIKITAIEVLDEKVASVDYEYKAQFLYTVGEQDRWGTSTDKNRLSFRREGETWKITAGL
jgi:hypothetical protein